MPKDKRVFAPFPIEMDEHPKIIGLSDKAFRALIESTFYCRRMLTDGFVDERVVKVRWGVKAAHELEQNDPERPSWVRVEGGWQIHDFLDFHPSRAEVEGRREEVSEARSEAGKRGAARRWGRQSDDNGEATASQGDGNGMATDGAETETETETSTTPSGVVPRRRRGTRIPDEFFVTAEMKAWAAAEVPGLDVAASTRKFVDYWRGASGASATKVDWIATWRNWLRKDFERMPAARTSHAAQAAQMALELEAEEGRRAIGA